MISHRPHPAPALLTAAALLLLTPPEAAAQQSAPQRSAAPAAEVSGPLAAVPYDSALLAGLRYRTIGPSRGGRVTTVEGVRQQPNVFYMGATGGGVWKTDDYGETWRNISDGFFNTASIGAIQAADSDPSIIYVGTGSDGIRSNVITGRGLYKSTDAGATWRFMGLREAGQIAAVEVHPTNPDLVYVAALGHPFGPNPERGIFRSRDGGRSWEKVLFVSDTVGASDVEFHPTNPDVLYAGMWRGERKPWTIISGARIESGDGIWVSRNGGDTWTHVTENMPELIGKVDFATSPADPDRVYALIEAPAEVEGLYRSDDAGATWRLVSNRDGLMDRPFYYTNVTADPTDADIVHVLSTSYYRSKDAGRTWERRPVPHGDNHDLWINPDDPQIMIQSNDGGANVTVDGGESWSTQLNQPTAELYQVAVDNRFPYWVYAGQQDNSTIGVPSLPPTSWSPDHNAGNWVQIGGCETGPAVPKPDDWRIVFSNCKGRFGVYDHRTGQERQYYVGAAYMYGHNPRDLTYRFQRVAPIHVSPHDPNTVYHGSQYVHRTRDGGQTWETISPDLTANPPEQQVVSGTPITRDITGEEIFSTVYAIEESPLRPGVIWVGSNDGLVHVTTDGGGSWTEVTPEGLPPLGRIQTVEASPHDPAEAYIAAYRYLLDDWQPYIFRTTDYGRSWTRLTTGANGIPADAPTRVVREDPVREGLLYAGTEFGMFVSFDEGASWQPFQQNLPVTPITDIVVHRNDLVISTMGRSFWILDDLTPLHQLTPQIAASAAHLFEPDVAYRMRYRSSGREPADPEYPEPGAMLYYWIGEEPGGSVTLDVLDERGVVIRSFSSEAPGEITMMRQEMRGPVYVQLGTPRLPASPGLHRFTWDLEHPGLWDADPRRAGRNGPLATPGRYQLRLTVGEVTQTRPLDVRADPRVLEAGVTQADMVAQLELNLRIRDTIGRAKQLASRIDAAQEELAAERHTRAAAALERIEQALVTPEDITYPQPMLIDQLEYLYGMTTAADQRPGRDAYARLDELIGQLDALAAEFQSVMGTVSQP